MLSTVKRLHRSIPTALFFVFCFLFLLFYVDPVIDYSANGMDIHGYVATIHDGSVGTPQSASVNSLQYRRMLILELTPEYFKGIAGRPGGGIRFLCTLIIYACHRPVLGAIVLSALILVLYRLFKWYLQEVGFRRPIVPALLPGLFILSFAAWYDLSYNIFILSVAGALAGAMLFRNRMPAGGISRILFLSLLFWLLWYVTQWGALLFLVFTIIDRLRRNVRDLIPVVTSVVNGVLFIIVEHWLLPPGTAVYWSDFVVPFILPLIMVGYFPLATLIFVGWSGLRFVKTENRAPVGPIIEVAVLMCCTILTTLWLSREQVNRDTRTIARTVYHLQHKKWDRILREPADGLFTGFPQKAGPLQEFMVHAVDRALCSSGRAGNHIFLYPQAVFSDDPLLMLERTHTNGFVNWFAVLDLAMDLGMVNTAEKIAGELMENMGPYPAIMYRRALVQLAKGNKDAAAVYLHKLERMPFRRTEARYLIRILDNDQKLYKDPLIAAMRAKRDTIDYYLFNVSYETTLRNLLRSNPSNRLAYDYLMTYFLLTGNTDGIAEMVPLAGKFGYRVLPRYWEEALCINDAARMADAPSGNSSTTIRKETVERFNRFAMACMRLSGDPAAPAKLAMEYGKSYFYFSIFRNTPGVRHE